VTTPKTDEREQGQEARKGSELTLEIEAVRDLEVDEHSADAIRGGPCWCSYGNHPTSQQQ
jgi:hypothetical protein